MRIHFCNACESGDHGHCEGEHRCPPGQYGGSRCICPCKGDPDYEKKRQEEARKVLGDLFTKPLE